MKHKAQHTNKQLRALQRAGHDVFPVFGRPMELVSLNYRPRTKFDPKPWVWGTDGIRFSAWELTTAAHEPTEGELAELRHEVEDTTDFVRRFLPCAGRAERELAEVA